MKSEYEKEWTEMVRIIAGIKRHSEETDPALDNQLPKVENIFSDFHKKYPLIILKLDRTIDNLFVRILFDEASVRKAFENVASKIKGLTGIGTKGFDESSVQDSEAYGKAVAAIQEETYLTYISDIGTESIVLYWNKKAGKVELNYEIKSLINKLTPQFQFVQNYAFQKKGENISFIDKCYQLGFVDLEDDALFHWEDEFYPKMLE